MSISVGTPARPACTRVHYPAVGSSVLIPAARCSWTRLGCTAGMESRSALRRRDRNRDLDRNPERRARKRRIRIRRPRTKLFHPDIRYRPAAVEGSPTLPRKRHRARWRPCTPPTCHNGPADSLNYPQCRVNKTRRTSSQHTETRRRHSRRCRMCRPFRRSSHPQRHRLCRRSSHPQHCRRRHCRRSPRQSRAARCCQVQSARPHRVTGASASRRVPRCVRHDSHCHREIVRRAAGACNYWTRGVSLARWPSLASGREAAGAAGGGAEA